MLSPPDSQKLIAFCRVIYKEVVDARLLCSSPAINAGTNADAPTVDYDNNPRPVGGIVDIGAYEKQSDLYCPTYLPLITK